MDRMRGTVDRLNTEGRFGFIVGPNGEEYFFHQTGLEGARYEELAPGVPVEFTSGEDPGDTPDEHLRAIHIRLAGDALPAVDNELLPPEKVS
jgi:cold shock CspA family protein